MKKDLDLEQLKEVEDERLVSSKEELASALGKVLPQKGRRK